MFPKISLMTALIVIGFGKAAASYAQSSNPEALTAAQIMKKESDRYTGDSQSSKSTLTLIDKKGRERVRNLKLFSIENSEVEKAVIYFMTPADVKGTAYMSFDWTDEAKEDEAWLYLPALEQVNRVAASDESGSFMGSDFSYFDVNGTDYEDFHYTLVKDSDPVNGKDCWVIESTPKDKSIIKKTGYLKSKSWVQKDTFMVVRGEIQLKKGKKTKYFSANTIEQIDGIWTVTEMQMITTRKGKKEHASVLKFSDVQYNTKVDESQFTTQAIQRGVH